MMHDYLSQNMSVSPAPVPTEAPSYVERLEAERKFLEERLEKVDRLLHLLERSPETRELLSLVHEIT